jgi:hypothetical protein
MPMPLTRKKFRKPQRFEMKTIPLSELRTMICAWRGCTASCPNEKLPPGWRRLMVYGGDLADILRLVEGRTVIDLDLIPPETRDRDGVLCPQHAAEHEGLLREIGNRLKSTAGRA